MDATREKWTPEEGELLDQFGRAADQLFCRVHDYSCETWKHVCERLRCQFEDHACKAGLKSVIGRIQYLIEQHKLCGCIELDCGAAIVLKCHANLKELDCDDPIAVAYDHAIMALMTARYLVDIESHDSAKHILQRVSRFIEVLDNPDHRPVVREPAKTFRRLMKEINAREKREKAESRTTRRADSSS